MYLYSYFSSFSHVALLAEGVDRNACSTPYYRCVAWSPSSRRAWIEIETRIFQAPADSVALLAEGVDRNFSEYHAVLAGCPVALLAEGVDRNKNFCTSGYMSVCRPPRGGRG